MSVVTALSHCHNVAMYLKPQRSTIRTTYFVLEDKDSSVTCVTAVVLKRLTTFVTKRKLGDDGCSISSR